MSLYNIKQNKKRRRKKWTLNAWNNDITVEVFSSFGDKINGIAGFACVIYFSFYFRDFTDTFFLISERSTQYGCQFVLFFLLCIQIQDIYC